MLSLSKRTCLYTVGREFGQNDVQIRTRMDSIFSKNSGICTCCNLHTLDFCANTLLASVLTVLEFKMLYTTVRPFKCRHGPS